jgi:hypothetical protein
MPQPPDRNPPQDPGPPPDRGSAGPIEPGSDLHRLLVMVAEAIARARAQPAPGAPDPATEPPAPQAAASSPGPPNNESSAEEKPGESLPQS